MQNPWIYWRYMAPEMIARLWYIDPVSGHLLNFRLTDLDYEPDPIFSDDPLLFISAEHVRCVL